MTQTIPTWGPIGSRPPQDLPSQASPASGASPSASSPVPRAEQIEPTEPCWRELMAAVFEGSFSAENRLEALMDHLEQARG